MVKIELKTPPLRLEDMKDGQEYYTSAGIHGIQHVNFRKASYVETEAIKHGDRLAFPTKASAMAHRMAVKDIGVWKI